MRDSGDGGPLYRDYCPRDASEAAADDSVLLDTSPEAAAEQSAQKWAGWFRQRLADELLNGESGRAIMEMVNGRIADEVAPLQRRIDELNGKVATLTEIVTKSARRSRR
jgi:hypothetical protein